MKINVGCGRHRIAGWQHVDITDYGDNVVFNLDNLTETKAQLPFGDSTCSEFILSHVIEHINDSLGLMQELWRLAKPGAILHIAVPFAFSESSIEDQTHVRQFTFNSFCFFSQPVYCNADYGYKGDWHVEKVRAIVPAKYKNMEHDALVEYCKQHRNICQELVADLIAVKPPREQRVDLVTVPTIEFDFR